MKFEYSNIELVKLLVNMMCLSTNNLEEVIKNINVDDFTNDICKQAYFVITEQYKEFNSICSDIELKNKLQGRYEDKELINTFIESIFKLQYNDSTFLYKVQAKYKNVCKTQNKLISLYFYIDRI